MILGLTGKNASGKGEVAEYLKTKGFVYYSLSDALRKESTKLGLDHSRNNLIKLGNEIHGPLDSMLINRDHVVIIEDLKDDSRVVQAINDYINNQDQ